MKLEPQYAQACAQLLREDDLQLPESIEKKLKQSPFASELFQDESGEIFLKIYGKEHFMLTQIVPLLQNIGLTVHSEISYEISHESLGKIHVSRYRLAKEHTEMLLRAKENINRLIRQMLCESILPNTPLLRLTLLENLSPRELMLLSAFIAFENQLVLDFNAATITRILIKYHAITHALLNYFHIRFDPSKKYRKKEMTKLEDEIVRMLQPITQIMEDRVIRTLFEILRHTVRTNYFLDKEAISFKVHTSKIPAHLKGLQPRIEAFVHHRHLDGVHLRMGPVSRGGLRWSDRYEDYRVEVRSLMLTQEGKNAVIVPSGAKGGFIIRLESDTVDQETFRRYYELYIDAMLDLVDNREEGKTVTDPAIVRYDGDDFYFVVAADKGTAHMSDVANAVAIRRNFWLGDAFASGGSHGYNHKELGITAKGALRSVERHFIEKGINFYETPITVVGIGSMNGDVFGNGMLASDKFKLLAAFSHRDIFVDPDPNPRSSYEERLRLFQASHGGWSRYDPSKISPGGGVFSREEKAIPLSPQMKKLFHTARDTMSGEEMVQAILKLKADMLFNGGVGTYVKASWESNLDVGDKANENVRVDATDLRVGAVCEGGNLGFTMAARIEFSKNGGFINLDAIDNSAGVNTSDYEVNLKITLGALVRKGQMDEESRLETLKKQADMVVNRVLWTNYQQSLAISLDRIRSRNDPVPFLQTIEILERELPVFGRRQFHIPKKDRFDNALDPEGCIVRPILGVLISYSKIFVKQRLLESDILEESFSQEYLLKYFPKTFATLFEDEILAHPLHKEIAATVMANRLINNVGATFLADYDELGKERFIHKIKSYLIANQLFGCNDIRYEIYRHDYRIPPSRQYAMLFEIENTLAFSVDWMLRHLSTDQIHAPTLLRYKSEIARMLDEAPEKSKEGDNAEEAALDRFFHHLPFMKFTIAAIILHERSHRRFDETAKLIYAIIKKLHINEIMEALENYRPKNDNEHTIKRQLEEFIEFAVTSLSERVIHYQRKDEKTEEALESYLKECEERHRLLESSYENFTRNREHLRLEDIAILVNALMQLTLEDPI